MGHVGGRGFGGSVKFADGKTSSANVPHLNVWGFDISLCGHFPSHDAATRCDHGFTIGVNAKRRLMATKNGRTAAVCN